MPDFTEDEFDQKLPDDADDAVKEEELSVIDGNKRWYVVHAYSGSEGQVKKSLLEHMQFRNLQHKFGAIMIPTEEIVEMRAGQKRKSERKFFPGYVLVQMEMDDETWHLVKSLPKVLGFIGGTSDRPAPISDREAQNIINYLYIQKPPFL